MKSKFTVDFPDDVVKEGADELTLRSERKGCCAHLSIKRGRQQMGSTRGRGRPRDLPSHLQSRRGGMGEHVLQV